MGEYTHRRRQDIVFLNILFCLLVIFIHITSEIVVKMPRDTAIFKTVFSAQRLSSFVVQGFLLLGGTRFFLTKGNKVNYWKYYFNRFLKIIMPYVIWVLIYYLYFCVGNYFVFSPKQFIEFVLNGKVSAHFYYIIIMVQFDLLAPLWKLIYKKGSPAVHIAFALIITVISNQYMMPILTTLFPSIPSIDFTNCFLRYLVYWTAGCMIGKHYDAFQGYLKNNVIAISLTFVFCGALNVALSLATVSHPPVWLEFIHIMYCMSAIIFFYMIAQLFAGNSLLKPLSFVDKSSYGIYLIHCLLVVMLDNYMNDRLITDLVTRLGVRAIVVYSGSILLCGLWYLIKQIIMKGRRR